MNKKAKELSEWYAQLAENDNGLMLAPLVMMSPNLESDLSEYIINPPKPQPKIIDLNMMIGSDIDMEFGNKTRHGDTIGKLDYIDEHGYFNSYSDNYYKECRIRQDHWHSWQGGECPLPEGLEIEVKYRRKNLIDKRNGHCDYGTAWLWDGGHDDIIAFKVLGTAENWEYEWESEE